MPEPRKFFRTVYTVEVLSEDTPTIGLYLADLAEAITTGDCSGDVSDDGGAEVSPQEMARLLIAQDSDPAFFQLDENGNDLSEER